MEIYILRHGTTEWNKLHRIQGTTDTALDALGTEMARLTGEYFRENDILFDRVFSSPLSRALKTAKLVSGMETPVTDDRLRELSFGIQEGRYVEEMMQEDLPFRYFRDDPAEYDRLAGKDESMESLTELCRRTSEFLSEMVENSPELPDNGRILISAHGACNKGLLMHIRGERDMGRFWGNGLQPNCGVDVVTYDKETGEYRIKAENRTFYPDELKNAAGSLLKEPDTEE